MRALGVAYGLCSVDEVQVPRLQALHRGIDALELRQEPCAPEGRAGRRAGQDQHQLLPRAGITGRSGERRRRERRNVAALERDDLADALLAHFVNAHN